MKEWIVFIKNRIIWYFKQLFPLWYWSKYQEDTNYYVSVWKMWFGKTYKHQKFLLAK